MASLVASMAVVLASTVALVAATDCHAQSKSIWCLGAPMRRT